MENKPQVNRLVVCKCYFLMESIQALDLASTI